MVDYYLLEALVTFSQYGTLAKTAKQLGVTQPAVTHAMKRVEEELGVQLFDRTPNKLILTETGRFAAQEAAKVLQTNRDYLTRVRNFDQSRATIKVAVNAPGPMIVLRAVNLPNVTLVNQLVNDNYEQLLMDRDVTCLLVNRPLHTANIEATYLGTEQMAVNLPPTSPLAHHASLTFHDLHDQTILSPRRIGFWEQIYHDQIPGAHILYQQNAPDYSTLVNYSVIPYFTTNLTALDASWGRDLPQNRVTIPLTDTIARQKFYACYLKNNHVRLQPLIRQLQDQWAQVDSINE